MVDADARWSVVDGKWRRVLVMRDGLMVMVMVMRGARLNGATHGATGMGHGILRNIESAAP